MGASHLRFCPISAGHGAGIPASAQGVPAVSVSSKPIAADAIECGNHAASRTSRTVKAARYAHIADSALEACLGATPVHGVHIGDSGAKPLPARKGLTSLRLCVRGGIQSLRRPRYVRASRSSGPRGAQTGRARP